MKKFLVLLAAALLILLGLVAPAHAAPEEKVAARYGAGSFTVGNAQLLEYGCFYHPYTVNLQASGGYYWDADIRILAPNGSVADLNYMSGTGSGAASFPEETFLCSSLDAPGTYTISGTITVYGYYYNTVSSDPLTPATFQVLPYAPPAPPAPPAPVYSQVTGKVVKKMTPTGVRLVFRSHAIPAGTVPVDLIWKVRYDGRTKKITQGPSETDTLNLKFARGRHVVKVFRNGVRATTVVVR